MTTAPVLSYVLRMPSRRPPERWLSAHGLGDVDASKVSQLDSVERVNDLVRVGQALAEEVKLEHFVLERFGQFY